MVVACARADGLEKLVSEVGGGGGVFGLGYVVTPSMAACTRRSGLSALCLKAAPHV